MYRSIEKCRICGNANLVRVLDLGDQALTGVFPKTTDEPVAVSPLRLVKCVGDGTCGLLQLEHTYELSKMYGANYGYRSGLNASMVAHLHAKVRSIQARVGLENEPLIIDIGSNDGTTLRAYPDKGCTLVGIDPTGAKFQQYYRSDIRLIPDFFSAATFRAHFGQRRARVVTSFSMFYDLEDPLAFMRDVESVLEDDGIWVFEQSYMPTMLDRNSYDTVCHEHLEYYALKQIEWMASRAGLKLLDVEFNDVNGGSFSVVAAKAGSKRKRAAIIDEVLRRENEDGMDDIGTYRAFEARVNDSRRALLAFLDEARRAGQVVAGLGASTKGNVLLQYCGLSASDLIKIGEVNADKFGAFTPGSRIPIVPQDELLREKPDYLLVLPWHFREFFLGQSALRGQRLVFPLPSLEIVAV